MKRFFFLLSLLISFSIGQVWGADPTISWAFKTLQTTSGTQGGITWETGKTGSANATTCNSSNGLVLYGVSSGGGYFQTTSAISGTITNVNVVSTAKKNTPKYTVYCSADGSNWTAIASDQTAGTKDHAVTGSYAYVKLANTTAATAQLGVTSITVTYTAGGGSTPSLSVSPTTIDFGTVEQGASVDAKKVAVEFANLTGSVTYSGLSGAFSAMGTISSTGDQITITPNTSTVGEYSQTLTVQSSSDNKSATVTVTMNVVEPFNGRKLTFDVSSNPGEWPTANSTTTTDYTYTLNEVDYTFALNNVKSNSGYLMLTATAKLGLPALSGYKLVKVEATNSSGCSTSTKVAVTSDESGTTVSGGAAQTFATTSTKYTYTLSGTQANTVYYLYVTSKNCQLTEITLYYEEAAAPAVETPTISGDENFTTSTTVTLNCTTDDASIYYTTDGTTPSSSSTLYSDPFTLNSTATVKAIAIKGGTSSSVAEMAFTKIEALTTMDAIFAAATTAGSIATDVYITFDSWQISGVKSSNAFLTDGTKGAVIYGSNGSGFAENNVLSGTVACKVQLFKQFAEITTLTSSSTGLTVTSGSALTPVVKTIDQLSAINTGALVKVENLDYNGTDLSDGTNTIVTYTTFYEASLVSGKKYNITGIFQYYNGTKQLLPRSDADIEEIQEEGAPETPTFSPAAGTYTSVQNVEISCSTEEATIYYTTDGTTPTSLSTQYTTAISVGENMTIKAIAIKNSLESTVATAAYVINLPEDESTSKTWDLSLASYDNDASEDKVTWSGTYVKMVADKDKASTAANNYLGGDANNRTSSRFYKDSKLTFTPIGKQITTITLIATSAAYASALAGSTWTNASAMTDGSNVIVTAVGAGDVTAAIGGTCGFISVRVVYKEIDASAPAKPTFTPAAGTYTEVQNVTISCETEEATIYYTTDGTTPTSASTQYTAAISVGENMTIKAIAIKDSKSSAVATAEYTINLPVDESTQKVWDLSIDETESASVDELTWSATYVDMSYSKGTSTTAANNYYPGKSGQSYTSTRFYNNGVLTINPKGKQITTVTFKATTTGYANALANSKWTNAIATVNYVNNTYVNVTANGQGAISATIGATCGFSQVLINYTDIDESVPATPTFTPEAGTYTSAQSVEINCTTNGATIYYTTDGSTPTSASTQYTAAISVDESMTIKAIAIKDDKSSAIATAVYTINLPLSSMDAIFAAATAASSTATDINIAFGNWVVSGVSTNGKNVYLTDGTKGLIIFDNGASMGFEVGDILSGTVACKVQLYKGAAELTTLSSESDGLSIAKGGVITPAVKAISSLSGINTGAPVIINSVQFDGTNLSDGTNSIKPFNSLFAYDALEEGKYYNVTGIYLQFESTKEILPRSAADIEELTLANPELSYSPESQIIEVGDVWTAPTFANPHSLSVSFESNNESVATVSDAGIVELAGGTGNAVITASFAGNATYAAGSATYTITVNPAGSTDNVVVLVQFNDGTEDKWLAMKHDLTAVEVNYSDGKIHNLSSEDQAAITWKRSVDNESNVTFQDPSNDDYLKGSTSTTLSVAAGKSGSYQWTWNETYYRVGTQTRTFLYQGNSAKFKNFAAGNAGKTTDGGYSQLPVVINPIFVNDDPEPPTPEENWTEGVRTGLTAGYYYTMCLNKAVANVRGASIWRVLSKSANGKSIILEEVTSTLAGRPYFFYATAASMDVVYTGDAVGEAVNDDDNHGLVGSFTQAEIPQSENHYILYENALYYVNSEAYVGANRAYLNMLKVPAYSDEPQVGSAPSRRVTMTVHSKDVATGVDAINGSEKAMKLMIDGQLFILRGEKLYDTTGRLVK